MDFTVDPCDNFYEFSCGSYLKYENIYDEKIRSFTNLENYILYLQKEQLEKPEKFNDPEFVKKLKKYYQSCLNKPSDMKQVIHGILSAANLDGWPLSENDNSKLTMEEAIALAQSYDSPGYLFALFRDQNSSHITISRGSDFVKSSVLLNTTEEKWIKLKKKYVNLIDYVLSELDLSTENKNKHIDEIIDFQTSLAKILDKDYNDNSTNTTISELHSNCSQIDWKNLFIVFFEYLQHSEKYKDEFPLEVNSMDFLTDLCELVGNTKNKRIIYNYHVWDIIVRYLPRIHNGFRQLAVDTEESLNFYDKIYESFSDINKLKWKTCIQDMEIYTELGLDYIMLKSMNRKDNINEVKSYVKQIRETLDEIFSEEDWFDSYSKNLTRIKLKKLREHIGYKNASLDAEFLNTMFNNINITDNYIQNILAVKKQMTSDEMFDQRVAFYFREEIKIAPMQVGASLGYDGVGIAIEIPLALMYPPFYAYGLPQYLNFGGMAFVIGHEYSHAFDHLDIPAVNNLSEFVNMEKVCHRYMIQYFHLKGFSPTNIKTELDSTLGESAPSFTTIKYLVAEFKRSHTSCQDEHRSGRPSEVTMPQMVEKSTKMVLDDSQLKVRELADTVGISKSAVHRILTENLEMKKLCARWVPRLLTMGQKQRRENVSIESLAMFRSNKAEFLRRFFITMDETWVHHFTPETKEQSKQ
ncbi:endothelin-converting enzyme 2-like [Centruroides sculpturatus]|uniref:endothelin-converting enzyme 2-like n=1 Tax=Centruroides sculpturatus TaxID=218467 RepID=UPI000C6EB54F|nr:endothelin-converting enzyme 2-like [Centruroides sculpturatus]